MEWGRVQFCSPVPISRCDVLQSCRIEAPAAATRAQGRGRGRRVWGGRMRGQELKWTATLRSAPPAKPLWMRWVWSGTERGVSKWVWLRGTLVCGGLVSYRQLVSVAVKVVECRGGGGREGEERVLPSRIVQNERSHMTRISNLIGQNSGSLFYQTCCCSH